MKTRVGTVEFDIPTAQEIADVLGKAFGDAMADLGDFPMTERPRRLRGAAAGVTDANGNLDLDIEQCSPGHEVALSRVAVYSSDATAGVPITKAAGFLSLLRSGTVFHFDGAAVKAGGLVLPALYAWGNHDAPVYRNGEIFQMQLRGYNVSQNITVIYQGWEDRAEV